MATEKEQELTLFDWEDTAAEDFFQPKEAEPKTAEPKKKEEEPKKEPEEEEEEEPEFDSFGGGNEPEGDEGTEPPKKGDEPTGSVYNDLYKDLKEGGIFKHVELEDGEELDADKFAELQEQEYETEVAARLQTWASEELDDDAKAFIQFKTKGGKTEDFFKTYQSATEIPTGDIDDEDYQDSVIRYSLAKEGWDKDEIEDRLQYLTDNNRKEKFAKKYDDKLKEDSAKQKAALVKQAEANKAAVKQQEEEFKDTIKDFLEETQEVEGFKITPQDKKELLNFLTKKDQKVSDTKTVTGFQKKLAEVFKSTDKMVLLAKLISKDFDMSDFEKSVKRKQTKEIKTNLEQRKSMRPSTSGSSASGSSLADLFN